MWRAWPSIRRVNENKSEIAIAGIQENRAKKFTGIDIVKIFSSLFNPPSWQRSILGKMVVLGAGVVFVYWAGWPQETISEHSFPAPQESVSPRKMTPPGSTVISPLPVQSRALPVPPVVQPAQTVAFNTVLQQGSSTIIDLNDATVAQLESLPGLGRVLAERIVNHRGSQGAFRRIEELELVPGIGKKRFRQIRPLVGIRENTGQ